VRRNKFTAPGKPYGEIDPDKRHISEEATAHSRIQELTETPIWGRSDDEHMKAIHRYVFQDVSEWADQERVDPAGDPAAPQAPFQYYPAGPALGDAAEEQHRRLAAKNLLRGLDRDMFAMELAEQVGWRLEPAHFAPGTPGRDEFVDARFYSKATGSNERLAGALTREIVPFDQRRTPEGRRAATRKRLGEEIERRIAQRPDRPEGGREPASREREQSR
jgi:cell filamentation protein